MKDNRDEPGNEEEFGRQQLETLTEKAIEEMMSEVTITFTLICIPSNMHHTSCVSESKFSIRNLQKICSYTALELDVDDWQA